MKQSEYIERIRENARQLCLANGLTIVKQGLAWRVFGNGVDILTTDLSTIVSSDFKPLR